MYLAFHQVLTPVQNAGFSALLALAPVFTLLLLLAAFRVTAWLAALVGSVVTVLLGSLVWGTPWAEAGRAYAYGAATGVEAVDWIVFWGVVIFNTLVVTGSFDRFRHWLVAQATEDVRVQAILLAWAFGALLEGLVGFGYPWSVVAPILIGLGVVELEALRVAALANNAPVSFGALGAPIIALAAVTGIPVFALAASIGKLVLILALFPPWVLIFLVSGWRGVRSGWPLAVVGSLGYIVGQFPVSQTLGPYLPDIIGSLTCFAAVLILLRFWRPSPVMRFQQAQAGRPARPLQVRRVSGGTGRDVGGDDAGDPGRQAADRGRSLSPAQVVLTVLPFIILVVVVVLWTGPWSPLQKVVPFQAAVKAGSSIGKKAASAEFKLQPFIAGTAILASWLLMLPVVRPSGGQVVEAFRRTWSQIWAALLVGVFVFGLAYVFNFSGMASSLAYGFSRVGLWYLLLAPILGWVGVALSGSNTSTNTLFGQFQATAGKLLHFPLLLLPSLNSVGSEIGKPAAIQTASVGVSTTSFVRREGEVVRNNLPWTLVILVYLIGIGCLYYFLAPGLMK